jgi:hypothetical protein
MCTWSSEPTPPREEVPKGLPADCLIKVPQPITCVDLEEPKMQEHAVSRAVVQKVLQKPECGDRLAFTARLTLPGTNDVASLRDNDKKLYDVSCSFTQLGHLQLSAAITRRRTATLN